MKKTNRKTVINRLFPSLRSAAAALGIPLDLLKRARNAGCPNFRASGRVDGEGLKRWLRTHKAALRTPGKDEKDEEILQLQIQKLRLINGQLEQAAKRAERDLVDWKASKALFKRTCDIFREHVRRFLLDQSPARLENKTSNQIRTLNEAAYRQFCSDAMRDVANIDLDALCEESKKTKAA